ncbi:GIP, partial [Symbiodinium microadriaticum]
MDTVSRRRRSQPVGELEAEAAARDLAYQTALSQPGITGEVPGGIRAGEASPGTLESGGVVGQSGSEQLPVANPFHSERVRQEVNLIRSRPTTLHTDAARFQGEVDEAALGDSWTGGVGEPDYSAMLGQSTVEREAPRVARVEPSAAGQHASGAGNAVEGDTRLSGSKPGMMSELGMGLREERTGGDTDSPLAAGESEAGRVDDPRELIPASADRLTRVEMLLTQVLEENQVLRRQIQAESHSSYHSTRTPADLSLSPMSFGLGTRFPEAMPTSSYGVQSVDHGVPREFPVEWYDSVEAAAYGAYNRWLVADPLGIVQLVRLIQAEFEAAIAGLIRRRELLLDRALGSASPTSPEALVAEDPETYRCWETLLQILLLFSVAQEYPEGEAVEESFPEGIEVIEEEPKDIEDLVLFGDLEVRNQNLRPLKSNCLKKRSKKGREVMLQVQGDAPAGNRAELAVQNLKGGVRKLLNVLTWGGVLSSFSSWAGAWQLEADLATEDARPDEVPELQEGLDYTVLIPQYLYDLYNTSIPFETAGDVARELHRAEAMNDWLEGSLWAWPDPTDECCSLRALQTEVSLNPESREGDQFLQTRTVGLAEARKELNLWKEPAVEEVVSLEETNRAVDGVKASTVDDWVAQGITVVQLPGKAVLTRKSGTGKKRCRAVCCGNHLPTDKLGLAREELYASGAESLSVKVAITYAAGHEHWTGVTIDVKSAFLYAPIRSDIKGTEERIIVKPPYLLVELGVMHKDDRWWIRKALYGLPTSPRDWGRYRDAEFRAFRMTWRGKEYQLLQTKTDDALWLARAVQEGNVGPIEGVLVVYVDDLAFFAPEGLAKAFISAVQSRWKTSEPAWLGEEPVTFCGIELSLQRTGYRMSQGAYIRELLHRYDVKDQSAVPMTKRVEPERAEALTVEEVREAQALTGALLWVSTRTRPDLSYVVSRWAALSRNMDSYPFLVPKDTLSVSSGSQGVDPSHEILEGPAEEEDDDEFTEEVGGSSGSGEKPVPKELTYEDFFEEGEGPNALMFSGPQWQAAVEDRRGRNVATTFGFVDAGEAYMQSEQSDFEDDPTLDELPLRPRQLNVDLPPVVGFGAFFDDSEVSSEGDSTGEPSVVSGVSAGSELEAAFREEEEETSGDGSEWLVGVGVVSYEAALGLQTGTWSNWQEILDSAPPAADDVRSELFWLIGDRL